MQSPYKSQSLAAILITHNDAAHLERALASVKWADEIWVLDQGSRDQTLAIARKFTDRVYFHPSGNRAEILNDAMASVQTQWVLFLEPDEWVTEMLKHEIDGQLLNPDPDVAGYSLSQELHFNGWHIQHGSLARRRLLRLARKGKAIARSSGGIIDLSADGKTGRLDRPLGREPYRDINHLFSTVNRKSTDDAYRLLEEGRTGMLYTNPLCIIGHAKLAVFQDYVLLGGMLDGFNGLILNIAAYYRRLLQLIKLRLILQQKVRP